MCIGEVVEKGIEKRRFSERRNLDRDLSESLCVWCPESGESTNSRGPSKSTRRALLVVYLELVSPGRQTACHHMLMTVRCTLKVKPSIMDFVIESRKH